MELHNLVRIYYIFFLLLFCATISLACLSLLTSFLRRRYGWLGPLSEWALEVYEREIEKNPAPVCWFKRDKVGRQQKVQLPRSHLSLGL